MNVVHFQMICHRGGDLPFEVIIDHSCWCVVFKATSSTPDVWNDDILHILDHGFLVGPMLGRMRDVPT